MDDVNDFKQGTVYKYTCPDGKCYIGQTMNEKSRKAKHKLAKEKTGFAKAVKKYGYDYFEYEILWRSKYTPEVDKLRSLLHKLEMAYIKHYNSIENGYNITKGGEGVLGLEHDEETKKAISEYAKNRTEEHKEKLKEACIGRVVTQETRKKISKSIKHKKKVYQYDLEDNFIGEYDSISEAARTIECKATLKSVCNKVSEVCSGKRKTAYKFKWSFEK